MRAVDRLEQLAQARPMQREMRTASAQSTKPACGQQRLGLLRW
jgi:hypothetical protein